MIRLVTAATCLALACLAGPSVVSAGLIPYANPGSIAPESSFYAKADGEIVVFFYGTEAAYDSQIGVRINGISTGIFGLPNHGSVYGESLVLGAIEAGDIIEFELSVLTTGESWFSNSLLNSDGKNHVYSTAFTSDGIIPDGWYIGFEDLPGSGADWDYNDHQFVVIFPVVDPPVGTTISNPEPSALVMWTLLGGAGVVRMRRRRS